jgi:hypothetical protein
MTFILGLDLGQAKDYAALVVVEWREVATGKLLPNLKTKMADHYHLRHLERFHLGTSYPTVVARVKELMATPELARKTFLVADATGVGRPVIDLLHAERLQPTAVTITGGAQITRDPVTGYWNIPKRDLVSTVQVLLQGQRLKFAEGLPEVSILTEELLRFEVKITEAGTDTYGAWREGAHDDLVLATALACWMGERAAQERDWNVVRHLVFG